MPARNAAEITATIDQPRSGGANAPAGPGAMSAADARIAFREFAAEVGSKAEVSVHLNRTYGAMPLTASLYLNGLCSDRELSVEGASFSDCLSRLRAAWALRKEQCRRDTITRMALVIIRATDESGACTEAALRLQFGRLEVESLGEEACARADAMAGRGPFRIEPIPQANASDEAA